MTRRSWLLIASAATLIGFAWWHLSSKQNVLPVQTAFLSLPQADPSSAITPLVLPNNLNPNWVSLGGKLFFDARLSRNQKISCASCHLNEKGGADGNRYATGINDQHGFNNVPSIWNAAQHISRRWDGSPKTLEEQALMPATSFFEMDNSTENIIRTLQQDPDYQATFNRLFDEGISKKTIALTIAEFERSLVSVNSPFDRWLQGDNTAISEQAVLGYQNFQRLGCIACHQGALVGGNMFEKLGVFHDYFQDRGKIESNDYGRYNVTGDEKDRFEFKVPSLRNIALTAPYFHDGSVTTLDNAIKVMAYYQLGLSLDQNTTDNIKAFLETLTGDIPASMAHLK